MERRQVVRGVGAVGLLAIAGCSGSGDDGGEGDTETTTTGAPGGGGGATTTTTGDTSTETTTGGAPGTTAQTTGAAPSFGDMDVGFADGVRFRVTLTRPDTGEEFVHEGRWNGGDFLATADVQGQSVTIGRVGGDDVVVVDGRCIDAPDGSMGPDTDEVAVADTGNVEDASDAWGDLQPRGTTEIDGATHHVFEPAEAIAGPEILAVYVNAATGRIRRIEYEEAVVDYWDWGNVGPIESPC